MAKNNETGEVLEETQVPETPEVSTESTEESPAENSELISLIKEHDPEADTSTPEALLASAFSVMKEMDVIYKKMYDLAVSSQEAAAFIQDVLETGDILKSLVRNFDPEEIDAVQEEMKEGDYEEDRTAHQAKVSQAKSRIEKVKSNLDIAKDAIDKFMVERKGWDPAKAEEFEKFVVKHYEDGADGLITVDDLALLEKGFNYDNDIAETAETHRIIGRNENIVAKKAEKKDLEELLPEHTSGMTTPPPKPVVKKTFAQKFMEDF